MYKILPYIIFVILFIILNIFNLSIINSILISISVGGIFQLLLNLEERFKEMTINELSIEESKNLHETFSNEIEQIKELGYEIYDECSQNVGKIYSYSLFFINREHNTLINFTQINSLNNPIYIAISTLFEDSYSLTTSNSKSMGNIPYVEKNLLQIFDKSNIKEIIVKHEHSKGFLIEKGFVIETYNINLFRSELTNAHEELLNHFGKFVIIKTLFYKLNDKYLDYAKLIEEQDLEFE
jgi:hypothetical protein